MRKLKFHEQKLLKKVNFFDWKRTKDVREIRILRKYRILDREDYSKYNKLVGQITKIVSMLRKMKEEDPLRIKLTDMLLDKLYAMGVISSKRSLEVCDGLSVSTFCRRRLAVVLVQLKFCENLKQSVTYIEQGHIRIGPNVVINPAYHVSRDLEDHVNWAEGSLIKRHVKHFNNELDDFELLGN